jgi:Tfp pilus assembly protein PilZ
MPKARRHQRKSVAVEFRAEDSSGPGTLIFDAADISIGGAFLKSDLLLEPGEELGLTFTLPNRPEIHTRARVAWVSRFPRKGQPPGMGVEFLDLSQAEREVLEKFLFDRT